ncbi:MAG TPA: dynamin family protein [Chthoniobacteraceae bacterium]|jgi:hypothetical protein|nr:dynamin family protein [Chthoniobacteraceae bacterium]
MDSANSAQLATFLQRCARAFDGWPALRESADFLRRLALSAPDPFRVAVIGRMKTGKSTLINSLIGRPLAITNVEEATATVNVISYGTAEQSRSFLAIWKSGRIESFPIERLATDWTGKSPEVLERIREVRYLQLYANDPRLAEFEVIDTPGTGSAIEAHEQVATDFTRPEAITDSIDQGRKADAIIYVITVGRESDADSLTVFGAGRLSSADPYNSVCVSHKWDGPVEEDPYAAACLRAEGTLAQLKDKVLKVLPISAPLGLAAQQAPDDFFARLLPIVASPGLLASRLRTDERWDADPARRAAREAYPLLPWSSFQMLISHFLRQPPETAVQARQACRSLSHLPELEQLLQRHFFANARVIKQCQLLKKAKDVIEPALRSLSQLGETEKKDIERAERAGRALTDPELAGWAQRQAATAEENVRRIGEVTLELDREWQVHQRHLEGLQGDLQILRHLHDPESIFSEEHHRTIRAVCERQSSSAATVEEISTLSAHCRRILRVQFDRESTSMTEHLVRRLDEAHRAARQSPTQP